MDRSRDDCQEGRHLSCKTFLATPPLPNVRLGQELASMQVRQHWRRSPPLISRARCRRTSIGVDHPPLSSGPDFGSRVGGALEAPCAQLPSRVFTTFNHWCSEPSCPAQPSHPGAPRPLRTIWGTEIMHIPKHSILFIRTLDLGSGVGGALGAPCAQLQSRVFTAASSGCSGPSCPAQLSSAILCGAPVGLKSSGTPRDKIYEFYERIVHGNLLF